MQLKYAVLSTLANGKFHSGQHLADNFSVSRTLIWKAIQDLMQEGIDIHSVKGKGYQLSQAVELLNHDRIQEGIASTPVKDVMLHYHLDSTNQYLLTQTSQNAPVVCLAEQQLNGRGRMGRAWLSPFAANIYYSLSWQFNHCVNRLAGLSLAVGYSVYRVLKQYGVVTHALKWPNDILWQDKKLAGILVEVQGDANGPCYCVIGIGLNIEMPIYKAKNLDNPWTDLHTILGRLPSRNQLVIDLTCDLCQMLHEFELQGFSAFHADWQQCDYLYDREVSVSNGSQMCHGIAKGIDEQGNLLLKTSDGIQVLSSGKASLHKESSLNLL